MERTERTTVDFGALLESLINQLIFITLRDGTRIKGDLVKVENGVAEIHSLKNVHFASIGEIEHVAVGKVPKKTYKGDVRAAWVK